MNSNIIKLPRITQLVREQAKFTHYEEGKLWYRVTWEEDDKSATHDFDFPVPIEDAATGRFLPVDRAMILMRWMRKHLEFLNGALAEEVYDQ